MTQRLIVALTGASGVIYGVRALEVLRKLPDLETHLIISPSALQTLVAETDYTQDQVRDLAHTVHNFRDIGAAIASGSFRTLGMLIAPCSVTPWKPATTTTSTPSSSKSWWM